MSILARCVLPHSSLVPRNDVVNTYAIRPKGAATRVQACDAFKTAIQDFYTNIRDQLSSARRTTLMYVEFIDLADEKPRTAFKTETMYQVADPSPAGHDLPDEVAVCISLQGATGSGINIRRRRGRVYIGPLATGAADSSIVSSTQHAVIGAQFAPVILDTQYELCVYSRAHHYGVPVGGDINAETVGGSKIYHEIPANLAAAFTPVVSAWVDNAWDIQRRRGLQATTRTVITPS